MLFSYQNKREWVVDVFACGTDMVINCVLCQAKAKCVNLMTTFDSLSIGNGCAWSRASAAWWQGDPDDG